MPLRLSLLKLRRTKVKNIIIHHTSELYRRPDLKIDTSQFQTNKLISNMLETHKVDLNYHFILEKVKDDYFVIFGRPFVLLCDFDIDPYINASSIHIGLLGDYNIRIPEMRMYLILAYRLISPLMKHFGLSFNRIKTHQEVSSLDVSCPGEFFDKDVLLSATRRFLMR